MPPGRKVYKMELELFAGMLQKDRDEFKRICNRLLSACFICRRNENAKSDYYFILKHEKIFQQYLSVLGYHLEINEEYGVIQLVNTQDFNRLTLRLYDSIILCLLRILYDEKKRELSLIDEVIVTVGDIQDRYMALKIRDKLIDRATMHNALYLFKRLQIIELLDRDLTREDARLVIYDSILMAVRVEDIKQVHEKIKIYRKGGATDETSDPDEID